MMRTEIEAGLIAGELNVDELPDAWNALILRDLNLVVPDDRLGVLQDIHWSSGHIGTFCCYTLGNVMASQLYDQALQEDAVVEPAFTAGDYRPLRNWLGEHIHRHGRRYSREELLVKATGRGLDPEPYIAYLTKKYSGLYDLPRTVN
jgi:carboxypeptidase Taq